MPGSKQRKAIDLLIEGRLSRTAIAEKTGVRPRTLARWLKDPRFLEAFHREFQLAQCQNLQILHQLVQGAYDEFLKRLSEDQFSEVSTQHLVQLLDRLQRQLEETQQRLAELSAAGAEEDCATDLLTEEQYHELAEEILSKIRCKGASRSQAPGTE